MKKIIQLSFEIDSNDYDDMHDMLPILNNYFNLVNLIINNEADFPENTPITIIIDGEKRISKEIQMVESITTKA